MQRRQFSREYKIEAVKLVKERGVSVAQAARDLDVHETMLRKWVREFGADPAQSFTGNGQMKPEQLEIFSSQALRCCSIFVRHFRKSPHCAWNWILHKFTG